MYKELSKLNHETNNPYRRGKRDFLLQPRWCKSITPSFFTLKTKNTVYKTKKNKHNMALKCGKKINCLVT